MHIVSDLHIVILCNDEMAVPAIRELAFYGALKAVIVPAGNKELITGLYSLFTHSGIKVIPARKDNFAETIQIVIKDAEADTVWIMTFPWMIPGPLLNLPPRGFINFHYGLLPKYRGSNPVLAQMLNYETMSGISIHIVDEGLDSGPIILQQSIRIEDKDTYAMQIRKLSLLGAAMATNLLRIFTYSTMIPSVAQDESQATYFKKPQAADLTINWNTMNSWQIIRMINACNPWNKGACAIFNHQPILFIEAEIPDEFEFEGVPGTIITLGEKEGLQIGCNDRKLIRINVICTPEGIFSSKKLWEYGLKPGELFISK